MSDSTSNASILDAFVKWTPVVVVLLVILWAGSKGMWYWGANARKVIADLEQQRNGWRRVAVQLLREKGVDIEWDAEKPPTHVDPPLRPPVV